VIDTLPLTVTLQPYRLELHLTQGVNIIDWQRWEPAKEKLFYMSNQIIVFISFRSYRTVSKMFSF
jgi:hypothetical protein